MVTFKGSRYHLQDELTPCQLLFFSSW